MRTSLAVGLLAALMAAGCGTEGDQPLASPAPSTSAGPAEPPSPSPEPSVDPATPQPTPTWASPLNDYELYLNPEGNAVRALQALPADGDPSVLRAVARIAAQPTATWFANPYVNPYDRASSVVSAAESTGTLPVLVVYGIPERDCGGYSGGGAQSREQYLAWVGSIAAGIGQRVAVVILEPDAVPHTVEGCLRATTPEDRQATLRTAVDILKTLPATRVYLDAGNASWVDDPKVLADALVASGLNKADGFALNTANYESTDDSIAYAREISRHAASDHFVIDTSRNGTPITSRPNEWCNNPNASLGVPPTTRTEVPGLDALLWIKQPGDSDGECGRGEPPAGQWWTEYAEQLAGD